VRLTPPHLYYVDGQPNDEEGDGVEGADEDSPHPVTVSGPLQSCTPPPIGVLSNTEIVDSIFTLQCLQSPT